MTDEHEPEHTLIYPFVVTTSHGGPYDDNAYVAGVEFGTIAAKLAASPAEAAEMRYVVRTDNVPQLDLAGAFSGWLMTTEEWDVDPSWSRATFRRPYAQERTD